MLLNCLSADGKLQYSEAFIIHPGNCGLQLRNVNSCQKKMIWPTVLDFLLSVLWDLETISPVGTCILTVGSMKRMRLNGNWIKMSFLAFSKNTLTNMPIIAKRCVPYFRLHYFKSQEKEFTFLFWFSCWKTEKRGPRFLDTTSLSDPTGIPAHSGIAIRL